MASIGVVNENCWLTRHNIWMKIRDWRQQQAAHATTHRTAVLSRNIYCVRRVVSANTCWSLAISPACILWYYADNDFSVWAAQTF